MPLPLSLARTLLTSTPSDAWLAIFAHALEIAYAPISATRAAGEVTRRDREIGALDLFLSTSGWDLWSELETATERTADALVKWWNERKKNRAVLILDGLSLRELPWIVQGANDRGYTVQTVRVTTSELPGDTDSFAQALGLSGRAALENNGAGSSFRLQKARTESLNTPWVDAAKAIGSQPDWVLWHHWPDDRLHDLAKAGQGIEMLTASAASELSSDGFWSLVERLTTGRRLIITSDHGYAASGLFPDAPDDQGKHLKEVFKSGRFASGNKGGPSPWIPPVQLLLTTRRGATRLVLGRRKWKSQAGYPTLTHGGLSILEVASPFIELSRTEK